MTKISYQLTGVPVDDEFNTDPAAWMVKHAQQYNLRYLLAHADDGVIWGRIDNSELHTSHGIAPASPSLHPSTLQQARLFSPAGELLLWRDDNGWRAAWLSMFRVTMMTSLTKIRFCGVIPWTPPRTVSRYCVRGLRVCVTQFRLL